MSRQVIDPVIDPTLLDKAKSGDAEAQYNLGVYLMLGIGVTKDEKEAVDWFHKAAEQGFANAQYILGFYLIRGIGVTKDEKKAVYWFREAAAQGHNDARGFIQIIDPDDPLNQYFLGRTLETGVDLGVDCEKNSSKSMLWYCRAATQGYESAIHALTKKSLFKYKSDFRKSENNTPLQTSEIIEVIKGLKLVGRAKSNASDIIGNLVEFSVSQGTIKTKEDLDAIVSALLEDNPGIDRTKSKSCLMINSCRIEKFGEPAIVDASKSATAVVTSPLAVASNHLVDADAHEVLTENPLAAAGTGLVSARPITPTSTTEFVALNPADTVTKNPLVSAKTDLDFTRPTTTSAGKLVTNPLRKAGIIAKTIGPSAAAETGPINPAFGATGTGSDSTVPTTDTPDEYVVANPLLQAPAPSYSKKPLPPYTVMNPAFVNKTNPHKAETVKTTNPVFGAGASLPTAAASAEKLPPPLGDNSAKPATSTEVLDWVGASQNPLHPSQKR